jgi:ATP-binding cassette subfamily F protein 3
LVSHDRYFISKTANKIWEIVDGKIVEFKGGYTEWVEWKERMAKQALEQEKQNSGKDKNKPKAESTNDTKPVATPKEPVVVKAEPIITPNQPIDKEKQKEKKRLQKQFDDLEIKIGTLKKSIVDAEAALADPSIYADQAKFQAAEKHYNQLSSDLKSAEDTYEDLFEKLIQFGD